LLACVLAGCGSDSKLELYTHESGNFRALFVGQPADSSKSVSTTVGQLGMTTLESTGSDQVRHIVMFTDLPASMVQGSDPGDLLDGGVRGMGGKALWSVQSQSEVTLDGHPGREVRFAIDSPSLPEKGTGSARVFLVGNRLDQAIMVGPASKVKNEALDQFFRSFELIQKIPVAVVAKKEAPATIQVPAEGPKEVAQASPPVSQPSSAAGQPPAKMQTPDPSPAASSASAPPSQIAAADPTPPPLLYEDRKPDLTFLSVATDLSPLEVAPSYTFFKGQDVLVIGNPSLGEEVVLENAVSGGMMSSRATIDGMNYLQLSISVNPGNSGGKVFDTSGRVIGVVTLKATKAESMAFCLPVEDLQNAIVQTASSHPEQLSLHRAGVAFELLTLAPRRRCLRVAHPRTAQALPSSCSPSQALSMVWRSTSAAPFWPERPPAQCPTCHPPNRSKSSMTSSQRSINPCSLFRAQIPGITADNSIAKWVRDQNQELSSSFDQMKSYYSAAASRPAGDFAGRIQSLRSRSYQLVQLLQKHLKTEVPDNIIALSNLRANDAQSQTTITQFMPPRFQTRVIPRGAWPNRRTIIERRTVVIGPRIPPPPQSLAQQNLDNFRLRNQLRRDLPRGRFGN